MPALILRSIGDQLRRDRPLPPRERKVCSSCTNGFHHLCWKNRALCECERCT